MLLVKTLQHRPHHVIWVQGTTNVLVKLGNDGPNHQTNLGLCHKFVGAPNLLEFSTQTRRAGPKNLGGFTQIALDVTHPFLVGLREIVGNRNTFSGKSNANKWVPQNLQKRVPKKYK
jgi:hypothetical protein